MEIIYNYENQSELYVSFHHFMEAQIRNVAQIKSMMFLLLKHHFPSIRIEKGRVR